MPITMNLTAIVVALCLLSTQPAATTKLNETTRGALPVASTESPNPLACADQDKIRSTYFQLDFEVGDIVVDKSHERLIVCGLSSKQKYRDGYDRIAVIDLGSGKKLISSRELPGFRRAFVDDKYVYIGTAFGKRIFRFDRDTMGNAKKLQTRTAVNFFRSKPNGLIEITYFTSDTTHLIDRETLELVKPNNREQPEQIPFTTQFISSDRDHPIKMRFSRVHMEYGVLDEFSGELITLTEQGTLRSLASQCPNYERLKGEPKYPREFIGCFGVYKEYHAFYRRNQDEVVSFPRGGGDALLLSRNIPAIFRIPSDPSNQQLEVYRLTDGKRVFSWPTPGTVKRNSPLHELGDRLVIQHEKAVEILDLPEYDPSHLTVPLHFEYQNTPVWDCSEKRTMTLKTNGGQGKLSFKLRVKHDGLEISPETGELQIDLPLIWKHYLNLDSKRALGMERYIKSSSALMVMRHKIDCNQNQVPFVIPVHAIVSDENGSTDEIKFFPIVLVPRDTLEKAVKDFIDNL